MMPSGRGIEHERVYPMLAGVATCWLAVVTWQEGRRWSAAGYALMGLAIVGAALYGPP